MEYNRTNHTWMTAASDYDDQPVDLRFYFQALFAHRWVIVFFTLGAALAAAVYVFTRAPLYSATARLQIRQPSGRYIMLSGSAATPVYSDQELSSMLRSHVTRVYSGITIFDAAKYLNEKYSVSVDPGELASSLNVTQQEPDFIVITATHTSPIRAAQFANAVASTYQARNTDEARREARAAQTHIRTQLAEVRADLSRVEEEMKPLKIRNRSPWNTDGDMASALAIASYEDQAQQADMEAASLRSRVRTLRNQLAAHPRFRTYERPSEDPLLVGLRQEKVNLEVQLAKLRADYRESDPRILAVKDKLTAIDSQIDQRARSAFKTTVTEEDPNYTMLASQLFMAENSLAEAEAKALALRNLANQRRAQSPRVTEDEMKLARLQRRRDVLQRAETTLLERLEEERINESRQLGNVDIVDFARPSNRPVSPRPEKTIPMAAAIGLLVGIGLAVLREYLGSSVVHTTDDLAVAIGAAPLGFIPAARQLRSPSNYLPVLTNPGGALAEAVHNVRASLKFATLDAPAKTFVVSSAGTGEGKTFMAADLAAAIAQSGQRVILVDADLRRPKLHEVFGLERVPGLSDALADGIGIEEVLQATQTDNLKVVTAGSPVPTPAILFETSRMTETVHKLSSMADVVVFDSAPIMAVSDTILLASKTDGIILVTEQSRVAKAALAEVRRMCDMARVRILGAVMNKVDTSSHYHTRYHYYRDYYKHHRNGQRSLPSTRSQPTQENPTEQTSSGTA
ncbi:MAG: GumC family protein [Armatimonadota bacterium]